MKWLVLIWQGHWQVYVPDCGRGQVPLFDHKKQADKFILAERKGYIGEVKFKSVALIDVDMEGED